MIRETEGNKAEEKRIREETSRIQIQILTQTGTDTSAREDKDGDMDRFTFTYIYQSTFTSRHISIFFLLAISCLTIRVRALM